MPRKRPLWRVAADFILAVAVLAGLLVAATQFERAHSRRETGFVTVNDGDSLTLNGQRIRLRGIDAPELAQTCSAGGRQYPCGRRSKEALQELVRGKKVECTGAELDKYQRLLAICSVGSMEVNSAMVASGWALSYGQYGAEEANARKQKIGVWAGQFERPRTYRDRENNPASLNQDYLTKFISLLTKWLSGLIDGSYFSSDSSGGFDEAL
ncbi:MAG: thermonuclease family protein [Rhizobiaceae bacterium]|nr:thermonuclease family protein [Rhizobiaceae bacterium]